MKAFPAAILLLAATALPAHATEWMDCSDPTKTVTIRVLLGALDVIAVNTVEIEAVGHKWSTAGGEGVTRLATGQAFETADQIWIDMTDETMGQVVARLRLVKMMDNGGEGDDLPVIGGVLGMPDVGTWPMSCSGP